MAAAVELRREIRDRDSIFFVESQMIGKKSEIQAQQEEPTEKSFVGNGC